jgi:hypothetical protein
MSTKFKILCGTPNRDCTGGRYVTDQLLPSKAHGNRDEAFRCKVRYLKLQGYEQIGPREFRPPNGGPIEVLTKRSRFGARLRQGKTSEGGTISSARFQPERGAGTII